MMTGYPDLDPIAAMLDALNARTDPDTPEWYAEARAIQIALIPIVEKRDQMETWLPAAWDALKADQANPLWGERMKKWLLISAKHTAYSSFLELAHATLTGSTRSAGPALNSAGSSMTTLSSPATTRPVSGPNTATTGTPEPAGSLITRMSGIRRSSSNDAPSATA